ncbi:MAG: GlsB/YeaQ/YmgE family stress response membrane protein [Actinomycetia bacterium]|nr:GlsB/YeaQ/YmgE family stress response membrane protein [Actinomycetes bacterium]MCP4958033.1 GlsB/YeaQ/YmgE family stress response membrane protein [Actinomycetes bacterium]
MGVVAWIVVGLIAGFLARVVVRPGKQMGCLGTIAVGLAGSVVGGTLANSLAGRGSDIAAAGLGGSILGAILILAIARMLD